MKNITLAPSESFRNSFHTFSIALKIIIIAFLVASIFLLIALIQPKLAGSPLTQLSPYGRLFLGVELIAFSLLTYLLMGTLEKLFSYYRDGLISDQKITKAYRDLTKYIIVNWLLYSVLHTHFGLLETGNRGNINLDNLMSLFSRLDITAPLTGGFVGLLSQVMAEGQRIQEEQSLTV